MSKKQMTIKKWLNDVYYDEYGQHLWSKIDGGLQMIGEIRGWGALQNEFDDMADASVFQDQVGKFIADAIKEKIKRDFESNDNG